MVELAQTTIRKARKEHRCDFCDKEIAKKEVYQHHKQLEEGEFEEYKHCLICVRVIDKFLSEMDIFDDWGEDGLMEWLSDEYCFDCEENHDCENWKTPHKCEIIRMTIGGDYESERR